MDQIGQFSGQTRATPYGFGDTLGQSLAALVGVNQLAYQQSQTYRQEQYRQKLEEYNARRQGIVERANAAISEGLQLGDMSLVNWGNQQLQTVGTPPTLEQVPPQQMLFDRLLGRPPQPPASMVAGLITPGTLNPATRPPVQNADGTVSTMRTITIEEDGKAVLLPTVIGGRVVTPEEAVQHYHQTGEHFGIFDTEAHAEAYDRALHERVAPGGYDRMPPVSGGGTLLDMIKLLPAESQERAIKAARGMGIDPSLSVAQIHRQNPSVDLNALLQRAGTPIKRASEYIPQLQGTPLANLPVDVDPITGEVSPASLAPIYSMAAQSGVHFTPEQVLAAKAAEAGYWKTQVIGAGGIVNPAMRMEMKKHGLNDNEINAITTDAKAALNQMTIDEVIKTPYGPMRQGDYSMLRAQAARDERARIERQHDLAQARAQQADDRAIAFAEGIAVELTKAEAGYSSLLARQNNLTAQAFEYRSRAQRERTGMNLLPGERRDPDQAKKDTDHATVLQQQAEAMESDLAQSRGLVTALNNRYVEARKGLTRAPTAPTTPSYEWAPVR